MNASHRIILNTIATYIRSVLGAGLALLSSRWVLSGLGQTDYGLFNVVGSIIVFVTFLNSVMAGSAARHYAFSLGQDDSSEVNRWFNSALGMHIVLGTILVLIGWQIGEYVIANYLTIPPERLSACLWVFRVSLISAFVSMLSIPFIAMFTAKQRIAEIAIWNLLHSVLTFVLAWFITRIGGDRLLFYAAGMVSIIVFVNLAQISSALVIFCECRIRFHQWFDKNRFKEIISFASWSLIALFGGLLRNQGSAILLNIQFGPRLNAAYGIANQVSAQTDQLAAAMIGAFSPEITTCEGRGDRSRMLSLAQRASKFGTVLILLFTIPLLIEMDYVLKLWLREPPLYSVSLCRLMLATFVVERLTVGNMMAVLARGKIAAYQSTVGTCLVMTLPLAWVFLRLGAPPTGIGVAFIITMIAISTGRVFWMRKLFGVPIRHWVQTVLLPCGIVASGGMLAALLPFLLLPASFTRLMTVLVASTFVSSLVAFVFAFEKDERAFLRDSFRRILNRMNTTRSRNNASCP